MAGRCPLRTRGRRPIAAPPDQDRLRHRLRSVGVTGAVRRMRAAVLRACDRLLAPLEKLVVRRIVRSPADADDILTAHRPVFIVGAPRSGTTLLYQSVLARWRWAYVPNAAGRLPSAPVTATAIAVRAARLADRFTGSRGPQAAEGPTETDIRAGAGVGASFGGCAFRSRFGKTSGALGPHEAGPLWYRWFPRQGRVSRLDPPQRSELRRTIAAMTVLSGAPFANKNVIHANRLAALADAVPEALFLISNRDPADTARSILRARVAVHGTVERWWSIAPSGAGTSPGTPPCAQVVDQVHQVERSLESDRQVIGPARFLDVAYADLCRDPATVLAEVQRFLSGHGLRPLPNRAAPPLPGSFSPTKSTPLDPDSEACIQRRVAELWPRRNRGRSAGPGTVPVNDHRR